MEELLTAGTDLLALLDSPELLTLACQAPPEFTGRLGSAIEAFRHELERERMEWERLLAAHDR